MQNDEKFLQLQVSIDNRCMDLFLTEEEVLLGFKRFLDPDNRVKIDFSKTCSTWPIKKPKDCSFWRKVFGICCDCG